VSNDDIVSLFLDLLQAINPKLTTRERDDLEAMLRAEFGGRREYVLKAPAARQNDRHAAIGTGKASP
jgi:hypothetical protein